MPTTQLQLRRGNTAQTAIFTGAVGEVTVDTQKKTLIVHDGVTAGGIEVALQSFANAAYHAANNAGSTASDAYQHATSSGSYANSAYTQANTATTNAATADQKAVSAGSYANGAFAAANTASSSGSYANSAYIKANSAFAHSNLTYDHAEAAFSTANNAGSTASDAYQHATSAGSYANGAFAAANTVASNLSSANTWLQSYIGTQISNLVDSAPTTLDTLNELAAALGDDANFSTTISSMVGVSGGYANGAFVAANTADQKAVSAGSYANGAFVAANTADQKAVSAGSYANSAYAQANTADQKAVSAGSYANSAYAQANTANSTAQGAFDTANTKYNSTGGSISGSVYVFNEFYAHNNGTGFDTAIDASGITTNAISIGGVDVSSSLASASSYANSAYTQANTGTILAQAAFDAANTAGGGSGEDSWARDSANSASSYANSAYEQANTGTQYAESAGDYANSAYVQANTGVILAQAAFDAANTAAGISTQTYTSGNGDFSGVNIPGMGTSVPFKVTSPVTELQTALLALSVNDTFTAVSLYSGHTVTFTVTTAFATGNDGNPYVSATVSASESLTYDIMDTITLTTISVSESIDQFSRNSANSASSYANSAYTQANTGTTLAQSAFNKANSSVTIYDETSSADTYYPLITNVTTGSISVANTSSSKLSFVPDTGTLTVVDLNTTSDAQFKKNIQPIDSAISILNSINGVSFNWKDSNNKSYGVIAQELQKILPELVKQGDNGLSVSYIPLIAILIESVKEQQKQIEELKSRV